MHIKVNVAGRDYEGEYTRDAAGLVVKSEFGEGRTFGAVDPTGAAERELRLIVSSWLLHHAGKPQ